MFRTAAELAALRERSRRLLSVLPHPDDESYGPAGALAGERDLGDVHLALEEHRRAFEFYQEAVRLEPREDEQPDLMHKLERLRKELDDQ